MIVIGVDGMDPGFVERHWSSLPNLDRLRREGSFSRLRTTTPPQSPVAWSTFITGLDPDQHGIYDFVHRDPATLAPFLSTDQTLPPRFTLPLGPYELPLSHSRVVSLRKGKAFWQTLSEAGIPVTILRMPTNYPPLESGQALAGMGVPDLRGTLGTFTFFTDDPDEITRGVSGGQIDKVGWSSPGRAVLSLEGPPNSLRKDHRSAAANLTVDVDPVQPLARISVGGNAIILKQGEWSQWLPVDFVLVPHIASARGMFRIYARQLHPRLEIYVSPVNIDPASPALPISAPPSFTRGIADETGRFFTLGIPQDTSALRQGILDLPEFLRQTGIVLDEENKLLDFALRRFHTGFLFFYFSSVDENSHILWGRHDAELLAVYQSMDRAIGRVRERAPGAALIVMSDHGFTSFDRAVNLNAWLREQGLLNTRGDQIDWSATRAYALGLNGLYLNLSGRERQGIVRSGAESAALLAEISRKLLAFRDPENGASVVQSVHATRPAPFNRRAAPDLIVGYSPGYRASWETALGQVPGVSLEDNTDAWIADHCIAADAVPGVLFSNRPNRLPHPGLAGLAGIILEFFGIS